MIAQNDSGKAFAVRVSLIRRRRLGGFAFVCFRFFRAVFTGDEYGGKRGNGNHERGKCGKSLLRADLFFSSHKRGRQAVLRCLSKVAFCAIGVYVEQLLAG